MRKLALILMCSMLFVLLLGCFLSAATTPKPKPSSQNLRVYYGYGRHKNGDLIKLGSTFAEPPPVVVSGWIWTSPDHLTCKAVSCCAVSNTTQAFTLSACDDTGAPLSEVWIQWIALTPMTDKNAQGGIKQATDGETITFPTLSGTPVIVVNAQKGGKALMASAASNAPGSFKLVVKDMAGNPVQGAWIEWLAVVPGNQNSFRGICTTLSNGASVTCSPSFLDTAVFVSSAQSNLNAFATAIWMNTGNTGNTGTLSLIRHTGATASSAWTQWLAYGRQQ